MPGLDIFNDDAFSLISLTAAINNQPYRPGQIGAFGMFEEGSITTKHFTVEERDGSLSLVEPTERGGPGETATGENRRLIPFSTVHYERNDTVMADEVQGVRAFGSSDELEEIQKRVMDKVDRHLLDLDMTLEHQRVGAIKGIVTSKSGQVLENLYSKFGIAVPAPVSLDLSNDAAKVDEILEKDVAWSIEDNLDSFYSHFHVWTGRNFHIKLWGHKRIRETFLATNGAAQLREAIPDKFTVGKFTFERYKTGSRATANLGAAYIDHDEGRVTPIGAPGLFITRFAPADYYDTVNTQGLPRYMQQIPMDNKKGIRIEVQSNSISLCTKPGALRRITL
ncbi:major capsid protein [Brucella intermedia]|uniref:major capsid protein n=1 Tax=Brucella intermedia TaxID=94625 RepID=UPI00124E58B3|nr:major capsid protein [Brucella intermedia]KAB2693879.1 major capsid protein [Brucella intermedia]